MIISPLCPDCQKPASRCQAFRLTTVFFCRCSNQLKEVLVSTKTLAICLNQLTKHFNLDKDTLGQTYSPGSFEWGIDEGGQELLTFILPDIIIKQISLEMISSYIITKYSLKASKFTFRVDREKNLLEAQLV